MLLVMEEIWKSIPNYEGLYEVSNLGRVKSVRKNKILKPILNGKYFKVSLSKDNKGKIHQLVAEAFLKHTPNKYEKVVDHINGDKLDNRVENLQVISQRGNISKSNKFKTSRFTGVNWFNLRNKWRAAIYINGKTKHLGLFNCELAASIAYQNKLKEIVC